MAAHVNKFLEKDCAGNNALVSLARSAFQDDVNLAKLVGDGVHPKDQEFVKDYLSDLSFKQYAPTTFAIGPLLKGINQLNVARDTAHGQWVNDFLTEKQLDFSDQQSVLNVDLHEAWNRITSPSDNLTMAGAWQDATGQLVNSDMKWSSEYLDEAESKHCHVDPSINPTECELWNTEFLKYVENARVGNTEADAEAKANDFWTQLESEWNTASRIKSVEYDWLDEYEPFTRESEYQFSVDNPFADVRNSLEEGKNLLRDGHLLNAILMLESAVKQESDNAEAWQLLGTARAENEQDDNAIAAFRKCIELDPSNREALVMLAVSLTNESLYVDAADALKGWLSAHPKYASVTSSSSPTAAHRRIASYLDPVGFKEVEDLLLTAVNHALPSVDADVQNALGILYNIGGDYDRAVDCFKTALSVSPDNARLWNRLGASLANSSRSDEAISAYHKALEFYPGFVRARYNLGISCINLKAYREAVEHFLAALTLQQSSSPGVVDMHGISNSIWNTLRIAITHTGRTDLYQFVNDKDISALTERFRNA